MSKGAAKKVFSRIGLYPSTFFLSNPLKVFEFEELLKKAGIKKTDIVLDIGCGRGLQTIMIGKKCKKIVGVDMSKEAVVEARQLASYVSSVNAEFSWSDARLMKFPTSYFDKIFSICVLEHIPNYVLVLKECHRILKEGGQLVFSVDSLETIQDADLIKKHRQDNGVHQYFRTDALHDILDEIGFCQINIHAIFRSRFARKLFIKGIKNGFRFGYIGSFLQYPTLVRAERASEEEKGIFLLVKCGK